MGNTVKFKHISPQSTKEIFCLKIGITNDVSAVFTSLDFLVLPYV